MDGLLVIGIMILILTVKKSAKYTKRELQDEYNKGFKDGYKSGLDFMNGENYE